MTTLPNDTNLANGNRIFYIFIMDNLSSHHNEPAVAVIYLYGQSMVYQALFLNVDGVIEYVLNTMLTFIQGQWYKIQDSNSKMTCLFNLIDLEEGTYH